MKVDLLYIATIEQSPDWGFGSCVYIGKSLVEAKPIIENQLLHSMADYFMVINLDRFSLPLEKAIQEIINTKSGELWHIGLKCQYRNMPSVLNYVYPVWLYNLDAAPSIASTSWRISAECFLVGKETLKKTFLFDTVFETTTAVGLDWGFRMYKSGVIIRYEPLLSHINEIGQYNSISLTDELKFIKRNFSSKWFWWTCFRLYENGRSFSEISKGFFKTYKNKKESPKFIQRSNVITKQDFKDAKVSVFTPTLQRYSYLEEELKQLRQQSVKPFEIFITDQTDLDKRESNWLQDYKDLNIIYQHQNEKGQCNAWNFCLDNATGDYVLFLGDDADEIKENFIEELLSTMQNYKADMVACNIKERENDYPFKQPDVFITDTFPICLVKREMFIKTGGYDYAYNKGSRADGDVAVRMYLNGALMVLNPNIKIHHHRAPVGGLRAHGQRTVTRSMSKKSMTHFQLPSFTELYLSKRYFSKLQQEEMRTIKKLSLVSVDGNIFRKLGKIFNYFTKRKQIESQFNELNIAANKLQENYPKIPAIK